METENVRPELFRRKRTMLLWLPLIVVPVLAVGFHKLDGGKGLDSEAAAKVRQGLNMTLPLARFDKKSKLFDKLGAYQKADADSAKYRERLKQDPYAARRADTVTGRHSVMPLGLERPGDRADDVLKQVAALREQLQKQQTDGVAVVQTGRNDSNAGRPDLSQLRMMTERLQSRRSVSPDPDMDRIERVLDKLNRVEHPGEDRDTSNRPAAVAALPVERLGAEKAVGSLEGSREESAGFIEIGETAEADTGRELAIAAVIDGEQTITAGQTVALRLTEEAVVGGVRLPRDQQLSGKASLSGERVLISIPSVRSGRLLLPVALEVYSLDGLMGIAAKGSITRDASKESAQEAMTGFELASMDQSLSAQAAGAGLQFAKSVAGRKIKLVRVDLPAGYKVLLKNVKSVNEKR
jgi:conjugative transposon TraM protein